MSIFVYIHFCLYLATEWQKLFEGLIKYYCKLFWRMFLKINFVLKRIVFIIMLRWQSQESLHALSLAFVSEKLTSSPNPDSVDFYNLSLSWNMHLKYSCYHSDNIDPAIAVFESLTCTLIVYNLSLCAGSQPPGKTDWLPPQVTGLLYWDQKLPWPSQVTQLLHPGAVWTIQLHHGRPLQGDKRGEMSLGVGWPDSSPLSYMPSDGHIHGPLLTHAFL